MDNTTQPQGKMTRSHLLWAQEHDWGEHATLENGCLVVNEVIRHSNGSVTSRPAAFETFAELKIWAGY